MFVHRATKLWGWQPTPYPPTPHPALPPLACLHHFFIRSWEAVLIVLDSRPFSDLHHIVADLNDDRVWVFAEWVSYRLSPAAAAAL